MTNIEAHRAVRFAALLWLAGVAATAAGPGEAAEPQLSASGSLNEMLPAAIRQAGTLRIAGDATFPPFYYLDEKNEFKGFDIDVGNAVAKALGVKAEFTNIKTEGLLAGLQAQRFDLGMSGLIDKPIREQSFDFVDYYRSVSSLLVKAGNPAKIAAAELCGRDVAVGKGTAADIVVIPDLTRRCQAEKKPAVNAMEFPDYNSAVLAVESGRAPASLTLYPINRWIVAKSDGRLAIAGFVPGGFMVGIAVLKGDDALVHAVYAAVEKIMADGTYHSLLTRYDIAEKPLEKPAINQPNP